MCRLLYILAGSLVLAAQSWAQAAEEHAAEEPGLFAGGIWTSIWTIVVFFALILTLGKFAWKPLLEALKKREDRIRTDINDARKEREEAQQFATDLKKQLADAQGKAQELLTEANTESEKIREKIIAQAYNDAMETVRDARLQIEQAKKQAMKDLYDQTVNIARDISEKILQREINPEDHRLLIEQGLKEIDVREGNQ
jgi:F-type H+-transporting ATPase subunit b